jgi:sterol desaturase/sphingolipid hydroxylase (fatty acid hydroxylase superfamily)
VHDPIALAVPLFFVLIAIEIAWSRRRAVSVYRFSDAITNLSCGITSQIVLLAWAALQLGIYTWVFEHARLVSIPTPWLPWAVAFLGVDFLYYWWHRLSHEVNVLWAAHVVHHSSEDYNLAVALRQAVLTHWTAVPFYLPLAVLGVPPLTFAVTHALSTLYQFWIHTQLVGKVRGPLDWILNLPSHHRVHHAINPAYLDKNYGATLIVWDRLFGTYVEETEAPVYGITKPLASFDPMWAQVHYWVDLAKMARAARRPVDRLRVWFASPAWKPEGFVEASAQDLATRKKYDVPISHAASLWVAANYVVIVAATFVLLMWHHAIPEVPLVLASIAILASLVGVGAVLEGRSWARPAEVVRVAVVVAGALAWFRSS